MVSAFKLFYLFYFELACNIILIFQVENSYFVLFQWLYSSSIQIEEHNMILLYGHNLYILEDNDYIKSYVI